MEEDKIRTFKDLKTWQEGHKLVLAVYKTTKIFPREESFRLVSQLCRAVVSITSNIAEGFSRNSSKEKRQFYAMSLGSLTEVENQIIISKDLGYIRDLEYNELIKQIILINKLIHGLMKSVQDKHS